MKIRRVYEELLKQEKRAVLRLKCLSGATAFIVFAIFLMVLLGVDVVQKLAKGFALESGNCIVEESIFTGGNVSCDCGMRTCFSRYPCLRVLVRISAGESQNVQSLKPVLLHNTFYDLGAECTYGPPCKPNEKDNFASVLDFKNTKGKKGTTLKCYFDRHEPTEVILDQSAHEMVMFHVFFWPCLVFFIGVCVLLKVYYLKRTHRKKIYLPKDISCMKIKTNNNNNNNRIYNYRKTNVFDRLLKEDIDANCIRTL